MITDLLQASCHCRAATCEVRAAVSPASRAKGGPGNRAGLSVVEVA